MKHIGIFDSGVGGFSVLRQLTLHCPSLSYSYVADIEHVPYTNRTPEELRVIVGKILQFFRTKGVDAVVFACNTSSALVLPHVRRQAFAPFFGVIEPGIGAALKLTHGKGIGVAANGITARSGFFKRLIREKNQTIPVIEAGCPDLVSLVEKGEIFSRDAEMAVRSCCENMKGKIDTLILGCTHFPFVLEHFRRFLPEDVAIIDPALPLAEEIESQLCGKSGFSLSGRSQDLKGELFSTRLSPHVSEWAERILNWKTEVELLKLDQIEPWPAAPAYGLTQ